VSPTLAEKLASVLDNGRAQAPHERLSDREFQVLRALGSGLAVKEAAANLGLSSKTVSTYRARLMEKMGLTSKADLVRYVVEHGLLT
jgi:DNA-binding NarL/FixJ family response regulator